MMQAFRLFAFLASWMFPFQQKSISD